VVIDIEHHLILWRVIWVAAIGAALLGTYQHGWQATLWGGLAGFGFLLAAFGLGLLLEWLLRNENAGLGGGDVNLAGVLGLLLGWPLIGPALLTAIFAGGLFGGGYLLVQRARRSPAPPFAYGPFLALSGLAVYLWPGFFRLF
jgi:leader peptidase (prepilin peptidase)/N-methyltransferase